MIDNDRLSFTYDRSDQPVAMGGAVSATYAYDAHNRRVKQVIDGETIYSVYGTGGDLLYRDNITTGEETINLTLGSRPVARLITQGGITTPTYLYPDHLGTASLAANASGYITWWESYSPFGETLNNAPQGFNQPGFTGHIRDTATGLNYMQARYYDPVIGRFLSNDPVGFQEGGAGFFNRYAYTYNDPVNHTDPNGEFGLVGGLAGIAVGALIETSAQLIQNGGDFGALDTGAIARSAAVGGVIGATGGVAGAAIRGGATLARGSAQAGRMLGSATGRSVSGSVQGATGGAAGEAWGQVMDSSVLGENGGVGLGSVTDGGAVGKAAGVGALSGGIAGQAGGLVEDAATAAGLGRASASAYSGGASGMTGGLGSGQAAGALGDAAEAAGNVAAAAASRATERPER